MALSLAATVAALALAAATVRQVPNWLVFVFGVVGFASLVFFIYNLAGIVLLGKAIPEDDPNGGPTTRKVAFTLGLLGIGLASLLRRRAGGSDSAFVAWFPTIVWILSALCLTTAPSRRGKGAEGGSDDAPLD